MAQNLDPNNPGQTSWNQQARHEGGADVNRPDKTQASLGMGADNFANAADYSVEVQGGAYQQGPLGKPQYGGQQEAEYRDQQQLVDGGQAKYGNGGQGTLGQSGSTGNTGKSPSDPGSPGGVGETNSGPGGNFGGGLQKGGGTGGAMSPGSGNQTGTPGQGGATNDGANQGE
jgi:hypothetical protein